MIQLYLVAKMNPKILLAAFVCIVLFSSLALAIPGIPNAFYGDVTVNGQPASDGTTVVAKINGVQVASITTSGGKYGYPIGSFYVDDPNSDRSGKAINFFVNGVDTGQSYYFCNGCVINLNLTATIAVQPPSTPSSGGGTGGGGGGGGGTGGGTTSGTTNGTTNQQTTQQQCQERWLCTAWSGCKDGIQTRSCIDENSCGTNNNEPMSSQPCSKTSKETSPKPITGMITAALTNPWYDGIFAIVLAGAIFGIIRFRKKSPKKKIR